jgi:hypothetical protein
MRDAADFDVDPGPRLDLRADRLLRPLILAGRDPGQHPLQRHAFERVAVGEVLIGRQR